MHARGHRAIPATTTILWSVRTWLLGLIGAVEIVRDRGTNLRFLDKEGAGGPVVRDLCIANGLMVRAIRDSIVCCPPLIVSHAEIDRLVAIIRKALDEAEPVRRSNPSLCHEGRGLCSQAGSTHQPRCRVTRRGPRRKLPRQSIEEIERVVPDLAGVARGSHPRCASSSARPRRPPLAVFYQTITGDFPEFEGTVNAVKSDTDIFLHPDFATRPCWAQDPPPR